jgi:hypothetical protein
MPVFKRVLGQLVQSDKEGQQRYAAEIALENITNETSANWATCINMIFCTRDPRRVHWLVELLFSLNEKLTESSFHRAM